MIPTRNAISCSLILLVLTASLAFPISVPAAEPTWKLETPKLTNHDNKSYSAGKFILFPTKEHRFVVVNFRLTSLTADPNALDQLAALQKAPAVKLAAEGQGPARCFDMTHLSLVDANGGRHPALWNTDDTLPTDVSTLAGLTTVDGRDPAHWSRTKRTAVKLTKEAREKLIKSKAIDANHPDYRTGFTGLLEVNENADVAFLFQLPETLKRDGLQLVYDNDARVSLDGLPGAPLAATPEGNGPENANSTSSNANAKAGASIPNWRVEALVVQPYAAGSYSKDQVSLSPVTGNSLLEVTFNLTPLRADPKAYESYAKARGVPYKSANRSASDGVRYFENRNLALIDDRGNRHVSIWNLDGAVRTHIFRHEVAGNRTSKHLVSSWNPRPSDIWVDAEQTFITRTLQFPNQPAITEHVTMFGGILWANRPAKMSFLFSVPTTVDHRSLRLQLDTDTFARDPAPTP